MKLFHVGIGKSGSTTLAKALNESGIRTVHWGEPIGDMTGWDSALRDPNVVIGKRIYDDYFAGRDCLAGWSDYDAVVEPNYTSGVAFTQRFSYWPQMDYNILRNIQHYHPDCLFLLMTRNMDDHIDSIDRWGDYRREHLGAIGAPGLPVGRAKDDRALRLWLEGHYHNMREFFAGDKNFLEVTLEDESTPDKIGTALGVEIKWWGKANVNTANPKRERR